jgi:hypothetical protein
MYYMPEKRYTILYVVNECMLDHERQIACTALTMNRSSRNDVLLTQSDCREVR